MGNLISFADAAVSVDSSAVSCRVPAQSPGERGVRLIVTLVLALTPLVLCTWHYHGP